jgi:hypothetical protein
MRRRTGVAAVAALTSAVALALGGCGDSDEPAAQQTTTTAAPAAAIELTVLYDDGKGRKTTGGLTCRGAAQRAEGALDGSTPPATLCAQVGGIADLLTTKPSKRRTCTQIYGGAQTAVVSGTIDGDTVDRRFTRTNGCEIADFDRAGGLLKP